MANSVVGDSQTFLDVVLMGCGTLEGAMAVAAANGLGITDVLTVGQVIVIPDGIPADYGVLRFYSERRIVLGTKEEFVEGGLMNDDGVQELLNDDGTPLENG